MKKKVGSPQAIKCSFCGRGQDEVAKLVSGPSVYICNECIRLCNEILEDEMTSTHLFDLDQFDRVFDDTRFRVAAMSLGCQIL